MEKRSGRDIRICNWIYPTDALFISTPSYLRKEAGVVHFGLFISSLGARLTKSIATRVT